MTLSDGMSSPPPGPSTSASEAIAYYKAQYESLESELAEFQASSKELEAELEKDIDAAEKRERQLKEKADNLNYEVDEWKTKYKQAKAEANAAQNTLQKEITTLRDTNRTLQMRLRDTEVANDDFERQQRNTESSLEDLESKYSMAIERSVMMEEEVKVGEQEREALRIAAQRLRDELSDLRIEAEIIKERLRKAEANVDHQRKLPLLETLATSASPRSELSPTTTDSSPSFDTPPGKTVSSSGLSDTHTPPSPPMSEKSSNATKPLKTPSMPKTRMSITSNTTPRPSTNSLKPSSYARGPSVSVAAGRSTPSTNFRQSMSRPSTVPKRQGGLAQSNSIHHLHNLQGKMQRLTERVHTAKSKLPAPINTPPRPSPRIGPTQASNIPATVTMRSNRRHANGSTVSGSDSLPGSVNQQADKLNSTTKSTSASISTPTPSVKPKPSRQSFTIMPPPASTPTRTQTQTQTQTAVDKSHTPFVRPSSRASASTVSSRASANPPPSRNSNIRNYQSGHPHTHTRGSMSISHTALGKRGGQHFTPNASTDKIRPKSSLSSYGYDGAMDEEDDDSALQEAESATPTPRRISIHFGRSGRLSDIGIGGGGTSAGGKRLSISRLPAPTSAAAGSGRVSLGGGGMKGRNARDTGIEDARPSSSKNNSTSALAGVGEDDADLDETF